MSDGDLVADAAAIIAGAAPPAWLVNYLRSALPTLQSYQAAAPKLPMREAMRLKLEDAERQALALARLLRDTDVAMFLENATPSPMLAIEPSKLADVLKDVAARAKSSAAGIPKDGGRTRARPLLAGRPRAPGMTPALFAAMVVAECWKGVRGRPPGKRNERAFDAANVLWNAASSDTPAPGWEKVFPEALAIAAAPGIGIRETMRNHMRATIMALRAKPE